MSLAAAPSLKRKLPLSLLDELPDYATLTLQGVSWEEYEAWLAALPEVKKVRISYAEGRLEIMPVSAYFNRSIFSPPSCWPKKRQKCSRAPKTRPSLPLISQNRHLPTWNIDSLLLLI